jgi:CTP:molybdopterin cytidylyltransferase MocA
MTVAAVILAATPQSALWAISGRPAVRRLAEVAWAGGGLPVVVVAMDRDGRVADALAGASAILADPAPDEAGPVGQIVRGIRVAQGQVVETEAALIWPARMVWVDPETVTSLIEAHGVQPDVLLRPTYEGQPGWPALLPLSQMEALERLAPDRMPDDLLADLQAAGVPITELELGDPGVVYDRETAMADLPPYEGPPEPVGGAPYEWGSAAADSSEDEPLKGPGLAPYPQASDPEASAEG